MHELPYFYSYYWSIQQLLSELMMAFQFQRILRIIYLKKKTLMDGSIIYFVLAKRGHTLIT